MTRPRLSPSDRSLPLRLSLGLYRFCASLRLAVVLITVLAVVLAWATFVESHYGHKSRAVHYGIYGTWWFFGLGALLGLNVLCAALIRFPWKEYFAGLLKTFLGRLVLGSFALILWLLLLNVLCLLCRGPLTRHFGPSATSWLSLCESCWGTSWKVLLGLNVLYAVAVHMWWKRRQTGFLITHAGILVLLFGCLLTYVGGIDAHLPVYERQSEWRAFEDSQSLKLTVSADKGTGPIRRNGPKGAAHELDLSPSFDADSAPEEISIPLVAGPFNWEDYRRMFRFPWCLARRDRGVVYDRDGIKLEVLDYYSDSKQIAVPQVTLRATPGSGHGRLALDDLGESVQLVAKSTPDPHGPGRRELSGGQRIIFWMAETRAETKAFLDSHPEGDLGTQGRIVLHADGRKFDFLLESFRETPRQRLGETGLEVELVQFVPELLGVQLQIHRGDEPPRRMFLLADFPELNQHDELHGVFGDYWFDAAAAGDRPEPDAGPARILQNARRPRIDIVQGADRRLYYRTWATPRVGVIDRLPTDGTGTVVLAETDHPLTIYVEKFVASDRPGTKLVPVPFDKRRSPAVKQRQVRLGLTVDGSSEEFWLAGLPTGVPDSAILPPEYRKVVRGQGRRVAVTMPRDQIDVGFRVFLHKFTLKRDPGSRMESHFSSLVDFRDRRREEECLQQKVLITMNVPANFSDPATGRSYRLYQSSYDPPLKPGDPAFEQVVAGSEMRDRLYRSYLAVNYDPGRGMKYVGSLMVCVGIGITFYLRWYFMGNKKRQLRGADQPGGEKLE